MKKLVKPFESEEELQLANALCGEFGGCTGYTCGTYRNPNCPGEVTCHDYNGDSEMEDDIIF